eukprot:2110967-Rhodomonas_salina.7
MPYLAQAEEYAATLQCVFCRWRVPTPADNACPACNCDFRLSGSTPQKLDQLLKEIMDGPSPARTGAGGGQQSAQLKRKHESRRKNTCRGWTCRSSGACSRSRRRCSASASHESGLCAATRLLQLRLFGVRSCSARSKAEEHAASTPQPFAAYQGAVRQIDAAGALPVGGGQRREQAGGGDGVSGRCRGLEEAGACRRGLRPVRLPARHMPGRQHAHSHRALQPPPPPRVPPRDAPRHSPLRAPPHAHARSRAPLRACARPIESVPRRRAPASSSKLWGVVTEASFTPALATATLDKIDLLVDRDPTSMGPLIAQERAELGVSVGELRAQHTLRKAGKAASARGGAAKRSGRTRCGRAGCATTARGPAQRPGSRPCRPAAAVRWPSTPPPTASASRGSCTSPSANPHRDRDATLHLQTLGVVPRERMSVATLQSCDTSLRP